MTESTVHVSMRAENGLGCSYAVVCKANHAVLILLRDAECAVFDLLQPDSRYLLLKHYADAALAYTDFLKLIGKMCKKQPDGHSTAMFREYVRSPRGFAFWRKVCMQYPESPKRLVVDAVHYVAESLIAGEKHFLRESPRKLVTLAVMPVGAALVVYIQHKCRK